MPDLIQVADDLKGMPDGWLAQQMQSPSGSYPAWLVAAEVQRRQKLRSGAAKAQAPTSSVSQDLIKSLFAKIPPTAGLGPQNGATGGPPGMPPVNLTPPAGGMGSAPPGTPPANMRMPARMAYGGAVDDEEYLDEEEESGRPSAFGTAAPPPRRQLGTVAPGDIDQLVNLAARKYKLPPQIIRSQVRAESSGDARAVSPKGARGLMQLMPETAAEMGVKDPDQLDDPAVNIDLGARYLRRMLDRYQGDMTKALAAYNAGPGNVDKHKGVPPFKETQGYVSKILPTVNGVRSGLKLPPLNTVPSAMRSRLLHGPPEVAGPQPDAEPPARLAASTAAAGSIAPPENADMQDWMMRQDLAELPLLPSRDTERRATASLERTAGAAKPAIAKPAAAAPPQPFAAKPAAEPLQQVWEPPEESSPMKAVAKQIDTMQQGHVPVEERRHAIYREDNLKLLDAIGQQIFGAAPDYSKYTKALDTVMALAQKNMHPSIGDSLMRFGTALMASKEHNFGVAAGQAGMVAQASLDRLRQEGMADYLAAAKAGIELQDKANQYNAKIGQYKMQRIAAQETGVFQDERTYQAQLAQLQRQYTTLAGNYQKALDVPREQALAGVSVLNRLRIPLDRNIPGGPPAQVARDAPQYLNEVLMAGKASRGPTGPSTTEKTQELRALSMLAERKDPWDPKTNPADQQYASGTDKLKAKYPVDAGKITVSASVMEPEDKKRAHSSAQAIFEGNQPPTLTGNSRLNPYVRQILQDEYGFNLSRAALEYGAVLKYQGSLNNPANINYQRNLAFVDNQIPIIQEKYNAWKAATSAVPGFLTRFKGFNRRALEASMSMGGEIGNIANQLNTSVLELQTALPNIYSGGYAPHTEDLQKAEKMLKAEWDDQSFTGGLGLIGELTKARQNAQKLVRPQGVRTDSPYLAGINEALGGSPKQGQEQPEAWPATASQLVKGRVYRHPRTGKPVRFTGLDNEGRIGLQAVQ